MINLNRSQEQEEKSIPPLTAPPLLHTSIMGKTMFTEATITLTHSSLRLELISQFIEP